MKQKGYAKDQIGMARYVCYSIVWCVGVGVGIVKGPTEGVLSEHNLRLGCKPHSYLRYTWSTEGRRSTHFLKHKSNWCVPEPGKPRYSKVRLRVSGVP